MDGRYVETHVEQVYTAGHYTAGHAPDSRRLASQYLAHLAFGGSELPDRALKSAVMRYHSAWQRQLLETTRDIEALGAATSGAAVTVAWGDESASALLAQQTADGAAQGSVLRRNPNTVV